MRGMGVDHDSASDGTDRRPTTDDEPVACAGNDLGVEHDSSRFGVTRHQSATSRHDARADFCRAKVETNRGAWRE